MKTLYRLLILLLLDIAIIWLYVYDMDPDPSVSIMMIVLVPAVFGFNLVLAGILLLFKQKEYARLFAINSVAASIVMYYLFLAGIERYSNRVLESWQFQKADTTFRVTRWKEDNTFSMSYSTSPGSSWRFLEGDCRKESDAWILTTDSTKMFISGDLLIGFRNPKDSIQLSRL